MTVHSRALALALAAIALYRAHAAEAGFVNITAESGVEAVIAAKYKEQPKWWLSGMHLVDLDGDGKLDLFLSSHTGGALALLGDGKGRFIPAMGKIPDSEIHLVYDIDGDGMPDLSMTHNDGGGRWWLNHSKPGQLDFAATDIIRDTNSARQQLMVDINRDGAVDWVRGWCFDYGNGKGGFAANSYKLAIGPAMPQPKLEDISITPIDIDNDGNIDLLLEWGRYADKDGTSRLFHNDGNGVFTDVTAKAGLDRPGLSVKGVGDFNHDGFSDIVALENRVLSGIYLNDGKGHFNRLDGAITGAGGAAAYASWGMAVYTDIDNDGIGDLLVDGRNFLKVLRGTGDGHFTCMNAAWGIVDLADAAVDEGLCFGDIDGDGRLDLIGFRSIWPTKFLNVYLNQLPKQHWLNVRPVGGSGNPGAACAKIRVYAPGGKQLLWYEEVAIYCRQSCPSYYAHRQTERHVGLGQRSEVDVSVEFNPSRKLVWLRKVKADQTVVIDESR